jgi:hypothetical protein
MNLFSGNWSAVNAPFIPVGGSPEFLRSIRLHSRPVLNQRRSRRAYPSSIAFMPCDNLFIFCS